MILKWFLQLFSSNKTRVVPQLTPKEINTMENRDLVIARMLELAPLNFAIAQTIAAEFGIKDKSVIAMATRNGIAYNRKPRVNKAGAPVASKEDLVGRIAENLGLDVTALAGLEKATKSVLETLVANTVPVEDEAEAETEGEVA